MATHILIIVSLGGQVWQSSYLKTSYPLSHPGLTVVSCPPFSDFFSCPYTSITTDEVRAHHVHCNKMTSSCALGWAQTESRKWWQR